MIEIGGEVLAATHTPRSQSRTVQEAGELWIKTGERNGLERVTLKDYQRHLDAHISPLLGDVKLADLSSERVEQFLDDMLDGSVDGIQRSRNLTRKVLVSLRSILNVAKRRSWVAQNNASDIRFEIGDRDHERAEEGINCPTLDEARTIINHAAGTWRAPVLTLLFTGLRPSELIGLTWRHVDLDRKELKVRQRADRWGTIGPPKSRAGKRDVPLPPMALNAIKEWKLASTSTEPDALVFPDEDGQPMRHTTLYRGFHSVEKAAGVVDDEGTARYGLRALRHFYASWLINQDFNPKRIQQLLGHSSIRVTFDIYGHWLANDDDEADRLASAEAQLVEKTFASAANVLQIEG